MTKFAQEITRIIPDLTTKKLSSWTIHGSSIRIRPATSHSEKRAMGFRGIVKTKSGNCSGKNVCEKGIFTPWAVFAEAITVCYGN
jgi:hypothetical protein